MRFLRKLFGQSSPKPARKSIKDLLAINFDLVPDHSFKPEYEVNQDGKIDLRYRKKLVKAEFGIFDTLEITIVNGDHSNKIICYVNDHATDIEVDKIASLINSCFEIYGRDDSYDSRGLFDEADHAAIIKGHWSGRMWTAKEHNPGALLLLCKNRLELVIWYKRVTY